VQFHRQRRLDLRARADHAQGQPVARLLEHDEAVVGEVVAHQRVVVHARPEAVGQR